MASKLEFKERVFRFGRYLSFVSAPFLCCLILLFIFFCSYEEGMPFLYSSSGIAIFLTFFLTILRASRGVDGVLAEEDSFSKTKIGRVWVTFEKTWFHWLILITLLIAGAIPIPEVAKVYQEDKAAAISTIVFFGIVISGGMWPIVDTLFNEYEEKLQPLFVTIIILVNGGYGVNLLFPFLLKNNLKLTTACITLFIVMLLLVVVSQGPRIDKYIKDRRESISSPKGRSK